MLVLQCVNQNENENGCRQGNQNEQYFNRKDELKCYVEE